MIKESLGERISRIREQARLTQEELEQSTGVARRTLQNIEGSKTADPGVFAIAAIAKTLGVSIDHLVYGKTADGERADLHVLIDRLDDEGVKTFLGLVQGHIAFNQPKNRGIG